MTIPPYLYPLAAPFLIPVARQLGEKLINLMGNSHSSGEMIPRGSALSAKVQEDPRYIEAVVEYSQRKEDRILEFQSLALTQTERRLELQQQEMQERLVISRLQRELMRDLQTQDIKFKLQELDEIWNREKWFSNLSRQETERILVDGTHHHRLLMLAAPPDMSSDCPGTFRQHLKKDIANGLRQFLSQHYPETNELRSVEFYADYFTRPLGDIEVRKLQAILAPVPTFILYSDINDYEINIHVGFWGLSHQSVSLIPMQPWNWEKALETLETEGQSPIQALRKIRQLIVTLHQILAAFLIDWYYLTIDPNYKPQLFQLSHEFPEEFTKSYITVMKQVQKQQRKVHQAHLKAIVKKSHEQTRMTHQQNPENWDCYRTLSEHKDVVDTLAISPDSEWMISGSWDNTIKIWCPQTGELQATLLGHVNSVTALAVSFDGHWIVSGSVDNTIKIWSAQTKKLQQTLLGHTYSISTIAISPDAQFIVSGSWDNTLKIWSLDTGELQRTLVGHSNSVTSVAISKDGEWIVSGSADSTIKIWYRETGELQRTLTYHTKTIKSVAISIDAKWVFSCSWDNTIKIWSVETGQIQRTIPGDAQEIFLAISPDSQWIASTSTDKAIQIRSVETGEIVKTLTGHLNGVNAVVFSPNQLFLASGSSNGEIKIWQSISLDKM